MLKRALAGTALAALCATLIPATPALADGRASTRNILLGAAAATYLIIEHNRAVHAKYAEDARRQAELQSENNDAWAAYRSEQTAYRNAAAEIGDLKREVAYQHNIIVKQRHQIAQRGNAPAVAYAQAPAPSRTAANAKTASATRVAYVSYGWGKL